jgi:polyhydroxyalkanoate synthase
MTAQTKKTMAQNMEKMGIPFDPEMKKIPTADEWKKNWEKMTAQTKKTMAQNMEKMGIPFDLEMKKIPTADEWKKNWEKMATKAQKTISQNMKDMGIPFDPEMKKIPTTDEWKKNWEKMAAKTQKMITQNMENMGNPFDYGVGNAVFNPEVMTKTFTEAMMKMAKKPEKIADLYERHLKDFQELLQSTMDKVQGKMSKIFVKPAEKDKRFQDLDWDDNPFFSLLKQAYLLNAKFLKEAVSSIEGLDPITSRKMMFYTSQLIDALSPTNFPLTNPTVLKETFNTSGTNLIRGFQKFLEDTANGQWHTRMTDMKAFKLGKSLATTPGKVVFQNDLFQLIQYEPLSKRVAKRPLLIIPSWINRYYIFDLKPDNSFVRWALESGLTVFVISWINPDERHAHKTITDYTVEGVKTAVDQVCKITGESQVNALGFCSGGTLLSLLMVYLKKKKNNPIASATILATPYDFNKADELGIYRCEHQQRKLEEHVSKKGYLEGQYMVQAFSLLRSNDLIWSSYVNNYLLGREPFPFDMLYWNCDALRMPAKMHMTYLRDVVIENRLMTPGSMFIDDVPVDLRKITTPLYVMAAQNDHIAPWRSVYPITQMAKSSSKRFVLGASGHVAGVINHPSRQKYHYWTSDKISKEADDWFDTAQRHEGSWWEDWRQWLDAYGDGTVPARAIKKEYVLESAPGSYVLTVAD